MLAHAHTWACTSHSRRPPTIHEGTSTTIVITPPRPGHLTWPPSYLTFFLSASSSASTSCGSCSLAWASRYSRLCISVRRLGAGGGEVGGSKGAEMQGGVRTRV